MKKILLKVLISFLILFVVGVTLNIILEDTDLAMGIATVIAVSYLIICSVIPYIKKVKNFASDIKEIKATHKKTAKNLITMEIFTTTLLYIALWGVLIFIAISRFTDEFNNIILSISFISLALAIIISLIASIFFQSKKDKTNL